MNRCSSALYLASVALLAFGSGCVRKYVEVRVHDGGRVGVAAPIGRSFVPVLAPDGSQGMAPFPVGAGPLSVVRQGRQIAAMWQGWPPLDLVDSSGALPPIKPGEGLEVRDGLLYTYFNVMPSKVVPVGQSKGESAVVALST